MLLGGPQIAVAVFTRAAALILPNGSFPASASPPATVAQTSIFHVFPRPTRDHQPCPYTARAQTIAGSFRGFGQEAMKALRDRMEDVIPIDLHPRRQITYLDEAGRPRLATARYSSSQTLPGGCYQERPKTGRAGESIRTSLSLGLRAIPLRERTL